MKISHTLKTMIAVLSVSWCSCFGQGAPQSPSVSSLMRFESYPTDYYTGMPSIGIPLYTMPTRSKDISIDLGLSYHASSVALYDEKSGDCGRGWTLTNGGSISWMPDENMDFVTFEKLISGGYPTLATPTNDIFQFNFMGFSGRFKIEKIGESISVVLTESKGQNLKIDMNYNPSTYEINSFTAYDDRGYKYIFEKADTYTHVYASDPDNPSTIRRNCRTNYHLTAIYDTNENLLASYGYNTFKQNVEFHHGFEPSTFKILGYIDVPGYGKITVNNSIGEYLNESFPGTYNDNYRFTKALVKDYKDNTIKRFDFIYDVPGVLNPEDKLVQVDISDADKTEVESYKLEYNFALISQLDISSSDFWGYRNNMYGTCQNWGAPDLKDILNGVLRKMTLPTGGSVIYEFESNTFSYTNNRPLEKQLTQDGIWYIDDNFFYNIDEINFPVPIGTQGNGAFNFHNYNYESYPGAISFLYSINSPQYPNAFTFNVSEAKTLYFSFNAQQYDGPPLIGGGNDPVPTWPSFTLSKTGSNLASFSGPSYSSSDNFCHGKGIYLQPGNYTMKINALNNLASGSFSAYTLSKVPTSELKKYWYGGGIRIKSLSYFTNSPDLLQELPTPARKISYDYSFFNEPNRSSGSVVTFGQPLNTPFATNYIPVGYKNVTVYDSQQSGGKTEYVFYSPIDYADGLNNIDNPKIGKLQAMKVYNDLGKLLQQTDYAYEEKDMESIGIPSELAFSFGLGWVGLKQQSNKYYTGSDFVETIDNYSYFGNRTIKNHIKTSGVAGELLRSEYTYHSPTFSENNRSEVETVENYRNEELISKTKINYVSTWANPQTQVPVYLPQSAQAAKASNALETNVKFNKYDIYGHLLESETENGIKTAYIWGYNSTQLVAKIEGLGYDQIPAARIQLIQTAISNYSEGNVISALMGLRNDAALSSALMTSYTYIPLVGVSTITDARGRTIRYEYDKLNRLIAVKDQEGNILTETKYHTKPQN